MPKESMTPKERWLAVLNQEKPDRFPMDYWATDEATIKVMKHLGCANEGEMYQVLHIDRPVHVAPEYIGPPLAEGCDMYGCRLELVSHDIGAYEECVYNPLAGYQSVDEVEASYTWPTTDWFDYSVIPSQIKGMEMYPIRGGGSEPFLRYTYLRGMQQAYMDLILNPEMVHYCLGKLFDFCYEDTRRIFETIPGQVNISYVAEDMGSQKSLLFSPLQIKTFLIPGMTRMIDLIHQAGAFVFHHSDGAIRKIIPDMIDAGIDVLNPIQWRCPGMEREGLKRDFGNRLVFHGGMDNQHTLPFGTEAEVRDEVAYNFKVLGENGGYILAPCHNIQAISPPKNIVAMYEAGYNMGWV